MTFDEWFKGLGWPAPELREVLQQGWEGALEFAGKPSPGEAPLTLGDVMRSGYATPPKVGDLWTVRVKGGRIMSTIEVLRVEGEDVVIADADCRRKEHRHVRVRRIEDLEWLQLVGRDFK